MEFGIFTEEIDLRVKDLVLMSVENLLSLNVILSKTLTQLLVSLF